MIDTIASEQEAKDRSEAFVFPDIDADIREDLAAVGIELGREPELDAARREALAATLMRLAGDSEAQLARLRETLASQVEIITAHYARQMEAHGRRRDGLLRHVEMLALLAADAGDFGRKKSAVTPFGEFGVKDFGATVQIADAEALAQHLTGAGPQFLRVTVKMPLDSARIHGIATHDGAKLELSWGEFKKTLSPDGALPPGVAKVEPHREAYVRPITPFTGTT